MPYKWPFVIVEVVPDLAEYVRAYELDGNIFWDAFQNPARGKCVYWVDDDNSADLENVKVSISGIHMIWVICTHREFLLSIN